MLPAEERCVYPECPWPRREDDADLCQVKHSFQWPPNEDHVGLVENDGIVDWRAIAVAATGQRLVRLSWVERDIAIAMIFGMGLDVQQVEDRTGYKMSKTDSKYRRLSELGRRVYGNGRSPGEDDAA